MTQKTQMNAKFNPPLAQMDPIFRCKLKMLTFPLGTKVIAKVIIAGKATPKIKVLNSGQPWCPGRASGVEVLILHSQLV